jgi:hypothetical protein
MKERLLLSAVSADSEAPDNRFKEAGEVFAAQTKEKTTAPQSVLSLLRWLILSSGRNVVLLVIILFICIGRQILIAYVLAPTTASFIQYVPFFILNSNCSFLTRRHTAET